MTGNSVKVLMSSAPIDRDVGRCLEEKRAQIADSSPVIKAQKPYIGFLGDFTCLVVGSNPPPQEANQGLVVLTKQRLDDLRPRCLLIGAWVSHLVGVRRQLAYGMHHGGLLCP